MPLSRLPHSRLLFWPLSPSYGESYRLAWAEQMKYFHRMAHVQLLEMADSFARYPDREEEVEQAWIRLLETRLTVVAVRNTFSKCLRKGSGASHQRIPGHVAFLMREARRLDRRKFREELMEQTLHQSIKDYVNGPRFAEVL